MRKLLILSALLLFPSMAHAQSANDSLKGFYGDVRFGGAFLTSSDNEGPGLTSNLTIESDYDPGFVGEGAFGYEFGGGLRAELALGFATSDVDELTIENDGGIGNAFGVGSLNGLSVSGEGEVEGMTFMLNGYYAFDLGNLRPYLGVGVGGAYVSADISALGEKIVDDNDTVFAYQGIAGLEYAISDDVRIGLRYSYFATQDPSFSDSFGGSVDSEIQSHNIMGTLRFML